MWVKKKPTSVLCLLLMACLAKAQAGLNQLNDPGSTFSACAEHYGDFRVDFDICNPFDVQLTNLTVGASAIYWNFGDGSGTSSAGDTSHIYASEGVYRVMMVTRSKSGCLDTVYKKFLMNVDSGTIFTERQVIVCKHKTFMLPGDPTSSKNCWWPDTDLSETDVYNPRCTPGSELWYHNINFKSKNNVVANSSFNNSNRGFSTGYTYDSENNTSGYYFIGPLPKLWNKDYENCFMDMDTLMLGDTMMIVNGSTKPGTIVWKQTVTVTPNTNYAFTFYGRSLTQNDSVELVYSINKNEARGSKILPQGACGRSRINTTWYSDTSTSIELSIIDKSTNAEENNFALDSIALRAQYINYDTIFVKFVLPPVFSIMSDSSIICTGDTVTLSASGGDTYQWLPAETVVDPNAATTKAVPGGNTTYQVIIRESNCGFSDTLSTNITLKPLPKVSLSKSNDIDCSIPYSNLSATGGIAYTWWPAETLSDASASNPVASPGETTTYKCVAQGGNSCISFAEIQVDVVKTNKLPFLIPNAFTPNGDGINDCFGVRNRGILNNIQLSVFNRFGTRVFYTTDPAQCWDGRCQGKLQDPGAFVYMLVIDGLCGKELYKGTLLLMK